LHTITADITLNHSPTEVVIMKVLVAIDGSPCSKAAVREVAMRPWPDGTSIEVLNVVATRMPLIPEPLLILAATYETLLNEARNAAPALVSEAADTLRHAQPGLAITTRILEGPPKVRIVEEAEAIGADLIVLGAHGFGVAARMLLGSVSQAVVLHAPCSVEIARTPVCLEAGFGQAVA
jgi:nucleotide-binding universal stress UspA family protein